MVTTRRTTTILSWRLLSIIMIVILGGSSRRMALAFGPRSSSSILKNNGRSLSFLTTTRLWETKMNQESSLKLTNQQLVQRRLASQRAKKQVREETIQQRVDRNFRIKKLLLGDEEILPLYAVKVWTDDAIRQDLRLTGREKRGRVFLEKDNVSTLKDLKSELHAFFRSLKKDSYYLTANLPTVTTTPLEADDLNTQSIDPTQPTVAVVEHEQPHIDGEVEANDAQWWKIASDQDVLDTLRAADDFFQSLQAQGIPLVRPCIQINVWKDPNAPPPPAPPAYLENMPDPSSTKTMTMLSFYAFPPQGIEDPEAFALDLRKKWKPFQALGRVYVAQEGVNAQMSVPTNVLENFRNCCRSIPELGDYMENDINIDPKPLSLEEFAVAGVPTTNKDGTEVGSPPFRNLHVRVRTQVVADGLDGPLDWQSAGYDMPPLEWHEKVKAARDQAQKENGPILLDCRNTYETDVGIFEGAEPLDTENFRQSWDVLKERLADTPKDAPIMTYCTGGIRCVKVGAYLTQELGFTNVSRLAGGIIAYDRTLKEQKEGEESMFKGTNFVFDGRLGRPITQDALGECVTCGSETSLVSNCRNDNCHIRMTQCETCRTSFHGTCSEACKNRLANGAMTPRRRLEKSAAPNPQDGEGKRYESLDDYSLGHSSPVPSVYKEMEFNTQTYLASGAHMVSGDSQGRMLSQLTSMSREGRVLELGTFTGYATACFLEGARNVGKSTGLTNGNMQGGPYVMTMERDPRAYDLAVAHLQTIAQHGLEEAGAEAICALRGSEDDIQEVEEDLVSVSLEGIAGCDLLRVNDALATVEAIAAGKAGDLLPEGNQAPAPFDIVFVDADKTRLLDYVEACLSSDRLLKKGGMIIVDNVLWKGLVLEAASGEFSSVADTAQTGHEELRKNRRARKLANQMHRFNSAIVQDERVEVMMLPMRDGLSVIRKR